jgi:hypothetical protein
MPKLLSGSTLRGGGSNTFIQLSQAQPQFPPDADTSTGYTISTNAVQVTTVTNSLGNLVHHRGQIYSNIRNGNITLTGTGTGFVLVSRTNVSSGTTSGSLVINGGVGIARNMHVGDDIVVNGITIGQGYEGFNNIVIRNRTASATQNDFNEGQNSIAIGWGALNAGLESANRVIAIGRNALQSGTYITNAIAIGDGALRAIGTTPSGYLISIAGASQTNPVVINAPEHGFITGDNVDIYGIVGMTEVNDAYYFVSVLDPDNFEIFYDDILNIPVDGTGYTEYISGGTATRLLKRSSNFALGTNAGERLIDGDQNFFFGDNAGTFLTTGSGNILLGHNVSNGLFQGSDNISIMGNNLQDGVDNQINIGAIFYYNGTGTLFLSTDVFVGDGTNTLSPYEGSLVVNGGVGISDNLFIGGISNIVGSLGVGGIVSVSNTSQSTSTTSGAVEIAGGVGIVKDLWVGGTIHAPLVLADAITTTNLTVTGQGLFTDSTNSTSTETGALVVTGGVGIGKDLWVGGNIYGPGAGSLGTTSTFINVNTATTATYYLGLTEAIGEPSRINSTSTLYFDGTTQQLVTPTLYVTSTASSTVTNTDQAAVVNGGLYVGKGIYSPVSGQPDENYLVYTPLVTISTTTPLNPRVGDFWIDPTYGVELQFLKDGTSTFWLQLTGF